MKILITGGAGFIGSHLTDKFLNEGYKVRVLDNLINGKLENLSQNQNNPNFEFLNGDILDKNTCQIQIHKLFIPQFIDRKLDDEKNQLSFSSNFYDF